MKKFLLRTAAFTACFVLLAQVLGWLGDEEFGDFNNKHLDHRAPWIFQQHNQELDFVILGSSRALNILDVATFEQVSGKKGINIASAGSGFAQNYLHLRQFAEQGNTFNTIILNVDWSGFHSDSSYSYPFSDYAYMPLFEEDWIEDIYYDEVPLHSYLTWKTLPVMKYAEFNENYPIYQTLQNRDYVYQNAVWDSTKGSQLLFDSVANFPAKDTLKLSFKPDPIDAKYFGMIVEYCKENNIKLLLYTAPYYEGYFVTRDCSEVFVGLDSVARANDLNHFPHYYNPIGIEKHLFRDYTHLNGEGAMRFSREFAEELVAIGAL